MLRSSSLSARSGFKGSPVYTKILEMFIFKLLWAFSLPLCAHAQDFTTDVRVVNLFAIVRDDQGRAVHDLTRDDFTLEEDGRPQTIRYFSQETGLPLTLGVLVDTSISQRRLLAEERTSSYRFLNEILHSDQDRAFVIHFDRYVELLQDLTPSREKLGDALARLAVPRPVPHGRDPGGTTLYDAVLLASQEVIQKDRATRNQSRKALVLLTDGVDNGSKVGLFNAIESAQRADTLVYSILFSDRRAYDGVYASMAGKKALQRISQETGGSFFEVSDSKPISTVYMRLEEELRDQYSIGYTSDRTGAGAAYRKIHLATRRPGLSVETRDGYYANK
jgi:VWFA-related protein